MLARNHEFETDRLARAIKATFARRTTDIPQERPDALTEAFANDPTKQQRWTGFVQDVAIDPGSLLDVIGTLAAFLMSHADKARHLKGN